MHNEFGKKPKFAIASVIAIAMLLAATTVISIITTENVFASNKN
jgi:hypothetical protein